tara:strand:+ start:462 stop:827 length:366 start_codon:yes stop_codon:yes gene_type:complete
MTVERISAAAIKRILRGEVKKPISCFIKFYSNNCHYCQSLKKDYHDLADKNKDALFYAFNIDDYPGIQKALKFDGVPTIAFVKTEYPVEIEILDDPKKPNPDFWYYPSDIEKFIERKKSNG